MLRHPGAGRRAMWWFLRKSRLLDTFDDEGYFGSSCMTVGVRSLHNLI